MNLSDDFIKGTIDKAMQENEEEPRPEARIKKKPGPKPGFKKKKEEASHQLTGVPEQKSVPPMPEVKTPKENPGKNFDIHLPLESRELVRKQLEGDLIIISNEVNELLERKTAIQNFLKEWE